MDLAAIAKKTWKENILFSVLVELTYRCNLDCFFCYNDTSLKGTPLSKEQYFQVFEDLAELNVLNLTLSGGEPLAHPQFFELGAKARELGFVVRIKSNGHALRGALIERLQAEVDPYVVEVSLHGATADVHDRQTRVPGSFDRLVENMVGMKQRGLRFQINSTMTRWNEHQVEEMMDIAERFEVRLQLDPEVTTRDDGDTSPLSIGASREGLLKLFRLQRERLAPADADSEGSAAVSVGRQADDGLEVSSVEKHCGAGSSTLAIDPYGEVYPCVQWRWSAGNLHQHRIAEIWSGAGMLGKVRELNKQAKQMVDGFGEDGRLMGFCPGTAMVSTGDPTKPYAQALEKMELQRQAKSTENASNDLLPIVS